MYSFYLIESITLYLPEILNQNIYSFVTGAKEQYENLSKLLSNMTQLHQSVMRYYAVDTKKVSVEEFFNDLNNFRTTFMVWKVFSFVF